MKFGLVGFCVAKNPRDTHTHTRSTVGSDRFNIITRHTDSQTDDHSQKCYHQLTAWVAQISSRKVYKQTHLQIAGAPINDDPFSCGRRDGLEGVGEDVPKPIRTVMQMRH